MVICLERGVDCLHMVQLVPLHPPNPHHLLPHLNPDWFYLSGTGTQVVLEKRPSNGCSLVVAVLVCISVLTEVVLEHGS